MKFLKRTLPIVLAVCMLASLCAVSAIDAGETRTVIGADLTDEQIKTVYKTFGIERGSVKELTVTNQDERQYLSGVISDAQIGTKSISCISIEVLDAGKGMTVNTSHITYCTSQMYISALATAGITDAKITVTAPFDVSGTAALTGVYKAYEDITGTKARRDRQGRLLAGTGHDGGSSRRPSATMTRSRSSTSSSSSSTRRRTDRRRTARQDQRDRRQVRRHAHGRPDDPAL